jgi:hypothetical protein
MNPPLKCRFAQVYDAIAATPHNEVAGLSTTGGVAFWAQALEAQDGRKYIALPNNNRIYQHDWGYTTNHMGKDGQRIGHYARPLDEWCDQLEE